MKFTRLLFNVEDVLEALCALEITHFSIDITDTDIVVSDCGITDEELTRKVILVSVTNIAKERELTVTECVRRTTHYRLAVSGE